MTTDTAICNLALDKVGTRSTIVSMNEDSNEAEACLRQYATTRDQVLRMAHWDFAKKTATLALLKSAPGTPSNPEGATTWSSAFPPPPWLYEYAYPSDCLQFRYVVPQVDTGIVGTPIFSSNFSAYPYANGPIVRWEMAADTDDNGNPLKVLLTNQYQAIGCYTYQVTNTAIYDQLFVEAFAAALAAKIVQPLSGERSLRRDLFEEANHHIVVARGRDGNEGLAMLDTEAEWIRARTEVSAPGFYGYWTAPYPPLFAVG